MFTQFRKNWLRKEKISRGWKIKINLENSPNDSTPPNDNFSLNEIYSYSFFDEKKKITITYSCTYCTLYKQVTLKTVSSSSLYWRSSKNRLKMPNHFVWRDDWCNDTQLTNISIVRSCFSSLFYHFVCIDILFVYTKLHKSDGKYKLAMKRE